MSCISKKKKGMERFVAQKLISLKSEGGKNEYGQDFLFPKPPKMGSKNC
jgi:hypothetical protein